MKHYPDVNPNPDFPKIEEQVLAHWQKNGLFQKSIDNRKSAEEFIFYDGPPFANGLPHYGHLLTGYVKDLYARYQTMRGKRVERRFGWDCHGLPAEMGSEKELGISGRAAIQNYGIDKFNEHCRTSVMKYTKEWEEYVTRQARWVDFKNDYKTMDKNFMESVLWAFKQLYDKGLVYEAHRVMPYSWAAETPLSNFETKLDNSYREREDKAITVAFELKELPPSVKETFPNARSCKILAWTTTPWTLPSNLALAVNRDFTYHALAKDAQSEDVYILRGRFAQYSKELGFALSEEEKKSAPKGTEEIFAHLELSGEELIGLSYHPLFPYFKDHKNAFRILDGSSFVTDGDGTGTVHMAPGFGEDDQKCCEANGIELVVPVDGQGKYTDEIFDIEAPGSRIQASGVENSEARSPKPEAFSLRGLNVIAEPGGSKFGLANDRIIDYLKATGQLIKQEQIKHNYPHCWRTDQPLIYRAMPSWYVEVTKFRDRAVEVNKTINWIPEHIRDGQMGHMLATAPDWSISRNRFWGTPIPVWRRESSESRGQSSEIKVFGSIAEMEDFFDLNACLEPEARSPEPKIADLHRPFIDTLTTAKDGSKWKRVEDVFDCWFESGSMPFAQVHYPFENKEWFEKHFPADFITEYVGQTRGWFNTLIMLSTALFDKAPFKNCICHGVMLGESVKDENTGKMVAQKLSKRLKNYPEPFKVFNEYGSDALRWFLVSSSVMRGNDLQIDKEGKFIRDVVRLAIKPIWNAYNFFTLYANADNIVARDSWLVARENIMDKYITAKCQQAVSTIQTALDAYDTPAACDAVMQFFEVLNNWYIRRNKERFWAEEKTADKQAAYDTLYTVLTTMCRAAAPLLPLTLDEIYKSLTGEESVHIADFPSLRAEGEAIQTGSPRGQEAARDDELIAQMDWVRDVCNAALGIRNKLNIRVRQPLSKLQIVWEEETRIRFARLAKNDAHHFLDIVRDEVNVKTFSMIDQSQNPLRAVADLKLSINNPVLGKRIPEKMKQIIPASKKGEWKQVDGTVEICGEKLLPEEFTLQLEPKPEYANRAQPLSTNDALVILDTNVTPELEAEGLARDMVRAIQQARKDGGLNVSDRIKLHVDAPEAIANALATHKNYVMEQTLSLELLAAKPAQEIFSTVSEIDDKKVTITIAKAV